MSEEPEIVSKKSWGNAIYYFSLGVFLTGMFLFLLFAILGKHSTPPIIYLMVSLATLVSLFLFYPLLKLDVLQLFADRLEVTSFFGFKKPTIWLGDIVAWSEWKTTAFMGGRRFTLYTRDGSNVINKLFCNCYDELKERLKAGKPEAPLREKIWVRRPNLVTAIMFAFIVVALARLDYYMYVQQTQTSFIAVKGTLASAPYIYYDRKQKQETSLTLNLHEYAYSFEIWGKTFLKGPAENFRSSAKPGDSVLFYVTTSDYESRIKNSEVGLWDKLIANHRIDAYGLQNNSHTFLTVQDYIKRRGAEKDNSLLKLNLLLALLVLIDVGLFWMGLRKMKGTTQLVL